MGEHVGPRRRASGSINARELLENPWQASKIDADAQPGPRILCVRKYLKRLLFAAVSVVAVTPRVPCRCGSQ
jgi:hypothetical protein